MASVDLFLDAHETSGLGRIFATNWIARPFSIRDQLVRATLLVDRLIHRKFLGPDSGLIIIGCGFSGLAATACALQNGIEVALLESRKNPYLPSQAICETRWVDPCLYDWPEPSWKCLKWKGLPWIEEGLQAAFAKELCEQTRDKFQIVLDSLKSLRYNVVAESLPSFPEIARWGRRDAGYQWLRLTEGEQIMAYALKNFFPHLIGRSCVLIDCRGFVSERTQLEGGYAGPRFWENDEFEKVDFIQPRQIRKIMISGGGDGAVQDMLRLIFPEINARSLLEQFRSSFSDKIEEVEKDLLGLSIQWRRNAAALGDATASNRIKIRMDEICHEHVDRLLTPDRISHLAKWLRKMPEGGKLNIVLRTKRQELDDCYPLNRFLGILAIKLIAKCPQSRITISHRVTEKDLENVKDIRAEGSRVPRHHLRPVNEDGETEGDFDEVIIRHGATLPHTSPAAAYFDLPNGTYCDPNCSLDLV